MNRFLSSVVMVSLLSVGSVAHAEVLGMLNGRSADLTKLSDLSVEGGFITGDDYDHFGARVNYRVSPGLIAYFDFGKTDIGSTDGTPFGIGAFYQLQDLISNADAAVKGSYHTGDTEAGRIEVKNTALSVDLLISGREPISANGLEWYGQLGIHRISAKVGSNSNSETELGFGGGVILPVGVGEAYFGIEHIDDLFFGFGLRYNL